MARIHARRRGKSGSTRMIYREKHPEWSALRPREVEAKIIELAKAGKSASEIGILLRDQYAVPDIKIATGKKLNKILSENNLLPELPEDLRNLIQRALKIRDHLEVHKKDYSNKRNLQLTESKIRRLTKYYKSTNRIPENWKYSPQQARLMFE